MLKKIIFIVDRRDMAEGIEEVVGELKGNGIKAFVFFMSEDVRSEEKEVVRDKMLEQADEILVVSDKDIVCSWCLEKKIPVIVFLHDLNKGEDFQNVQYGIEEFSGLETKYFEQVYLRAHEIPWTILETKRCIIREMAEEDIEDLYDIYEEPEITLYMDGLYDDKKQEIEYIENYRKYVYSFYGYGMWLVTLKDSGKVIGRAGLESKEGAEGLELGYVIAVNYQRQGYAYEVCTAIIQYGLEELHINRYTIFTESKNIKSCFLAQKLGFQIQKQIWQNGKEYHIYVKILDFVN